MDKVCQWNNDDARVMVHSKKAIEAALFLTFIVYTIAVIISEVKRNTQVIITNDNYFILRIIFISD